MRGFAPVPSDEPSALGGSDEAPNPAEQLLGAFGNCLAVGYAANATVLGIELRGVTIGLEGDIDLRTFLGLAAGNVLHPRRLGCRFADAADASLEQLRGLHEKVVGSSPVGHTLTRAVPVHIALAPQAERRSAAAS